VISAISLHRRVFSRFVLWLGLAALMVQAMVPLCAAGLMGGAGGGIASVVICTVHGFETVQIGADGKPIPSGPAHGASDCCSACHAPTGFTPPAPIRVAVPSVIRFENPRVLTVPLVEQRFYSSYVTRGPPAALLWNLA